MDTQPNSSLLTLFLTMSLMRCDNRQQNMDHGSCPGTSCRHETDRSCNRSEQKKNWLVSQSQTWLDSDYVARNFKHTRRCWQSLGQYSHQYGKMI